MAATCITRRDGCDMYHPPPICLSHPPPLCLGEPAFISVFWGNVCVCVCVCQGPTDTVWASSKMRSFAPTYDSILVDLCRKTPSTVLSEAATQAQVIPLTSPKPSHANLNPSTLNRYTRNVSPQPLSLPAS